MSYNVLLSYDLPESNGTLHEKFKEECIKHGWVDVDVTTTIKKEFYGQDENAVVTLIFPEMDKIRKDLKITKVKYAFQIGKRPIETIEL